ncbi:hypothetical protein ACFQJC_04280 [Haloferax namakaokahaiae]|uniref:Uncharacterized protein n=1 Tax=Haloferax namakaokahaiae TaxID=1748331 RepID=A0ABD5ZBQ2_9EURY
MVGDNSSQFEIDIEEAKRRIDFQIETVRVKRHQATRVIRTLVAVTGLVISASFGLYNLFINGNIQPPNLVPPSVAAKNLANSLGFLRPTGANFLYSLAVISALVNFALAQGRLTTGLQAVFAIISPKVVEPGLEAETIQNRLDNPQDYQNKHQAQIEAREEYSRVVRENQTVVSDVKRNWEETYTSLLRGGLNLFVLIFTAGSLLSGNSGLIEITLVILTFQIIFGISTHIPKEWLKNTYTYNIKSDSPFIITFLYLIYLFGHPHQETILYSLVVLLGLLLSILSSIWSVWVSQNEHNLHTIIRNTSISILLVVLMTIFQPFSFSSGRYGIEVIGASLLFTFIWQAMIITTVNLSTIVMNSKSRLTNLARSAIEYIMSEWSRGHWSSKHNRNEDN